MDKNELKKEKEKLNNKLKDYKTTEESNLSQIKILKSYIKEIEKQKNNESDSNKKKKIVKKRN